MSDRSDRSDLAAALRQALDALSAAVARELARHPQGHLVDGVEHVDVALCVPVARPERSATQADSESVAHAERSLRAEIDALVADRAAFAPGRVPNLRTGTAEGPETSPPDARYAFGGWSPSGVPRFLDFAQLLLERQHPEQHRLYEKPPGLLTLTMSPADLRRELLPAFGDVPSPLRVHGQVVAGWFAVRRRDDTDAVLALTLQVVSTGQGARRRYALNVLGVGPDGEPLEELVARLDAEAGWSPPWKPAVDWAQASLATLAASKGRRGGRGEAEKVVERRIEGILGGLARRLEQRHRARRRRTDHAQDRHRSGERPTRMALRDLAAANDDEILVDERRATLVVLGDRGRAHVFNEIGKLVTSIRYTPESIERKKQREVWRPASQAEIQTLRKVVGV